MYSASDARSPYILRHAGSGAGGVEALETAQGQREHPLIVVSPEYNHGYSAVLKNAFDHIYPEWARKPIGFVGYGNAGSARAIEQLRQVAVELQMWPIKAAIHIPTDVYLAVMKQQPVPPDPAVFDPLKTSPFGDRVAMFFGDLLWAAGALKEARAR